MSVAVNNAAAGVPGGGVQLLAKAGMAFGYAPTGTIAASATTGNLTITGVALDLTYGPTGFNVPGIWLYFPANAVSGDAVGGLYWCVMTSTTVGTVYNVKYAPPGIPQIPVGATIVTGSGVAYATPLATALYAPIIAVPGNAMGLYGSTRITVEGTWNNNANSKLLTACVGTTTAMSTSVSCASVTGTTSNSGRIQGEFGARGATNSSWGTTGSAISAFGAAASVPSPKNWDTTQNIYAAGVCQVNVAGDWAIIQALTVEVLPG